MSKPRLNYVVDFFAFIFFVVSAVSGLAMLIFMPSGVRQGKIMKANQAKIKKSKMSADNFFCQSFLFMLI